MVPLNAQLGISRSPWSKLARRADNLGRMRRMFAVVLACCAGCGTTEQPPVEAASDAAVDPGPVIARASGFEPGWLLEVDAARIRFEYDYGERAATVPLVERLEEQGAQVFEGRTGDSRLRARFVGTPCTAPSGRPMPETVVVQFESRTWHGCGTLDPEADAER